MNKLFDWLESFENATLYVYNWFWFTWGMSVGIGLLSIFNILFVNNLDRIIFPDQLFNAIWWAIGCLAIVCASLCFIWVLAYHQELKQEDVEH